MLIFEILIELFIIVFGSILGALFGFVLVINMNIFNDFPIIYSFDNNLVMELIGIFSILTVLELTASAPSVFTSFALFLIDHGLWKLQPKEFQNQ